MFRFEAKVSQADNVHGYAPLFRVPLRQVAPGLAVHKVLVGLPVAQSGAVES
jgi:hypothetical protein